MNILSVESKNFQIDYGPPLIQLKDFFIHKNNLPLKIIARNGSGKSSLVLTLANAIPVDIKGIVNINFNINTNKGCYSNSQFKEHISIIPQKWKYGLLGFQPLEEIKLSNPTPSNWGNYLINELQIPKLNKIPCSYLSDGEKKRLLICNALYKNNPLLISDEWTTHLDEHWINKINLVFKHYHQQGGFHLEFHSEIDSLNQNNLILTTEEEIFIPTNLLEQFINILKSDNTKYITQNLNIKLNKSLNIEGKPGNIFQIIGQNGSGKTTLLKQIWRKMSVTKLLFIKQNPYLLFIPTDPTYHVVGPSVFDELQKINLLNNDAINFFFKTIFNKELDTDVFALSFGQRKLLAIIIGLLSNYPIIAIDEPFSSLDSLNNKLVQLTINHALSKGKIIIIAGQNKVVEMANSKYINI